MKVGIPQPLVGYTRADEVEAHGTSVDALLHDLDRQFPGIRFRMIDEQGRIRPHMRIFVNRERIPGIEQPLAPADRIQILQALSGG